MDKFNIKKIKLYFWASIWLWAQCFTNKFLVISSMLLYLELVPQFATQVFMIFSVQIIYHHCHHYHFYLWFWDFYYLWPFFFFLLVYFLGFAHCRQFRASEFIQGNFLSLGITDIPILRGKKFSKVRRKIDLAYSCFYMEYW